jgi:signal transduction histidine kinase
MNLMTRVILIVSADSASVQGCIEELAAFGGRYRTQVADSVEQARLAIVRTAPSAVFLDESAIRPEHGEDALESAASLLSETAPVVVAAAPEKQMAMAFLITCGVVDFVARASRYLPIVAGLLDRRVRIAERAAGMVQLSKDELVADFGEILRHEVNNPLTGILGNTELLLARRDRLPPSAIERLETIAELAVRLRETVRRLSNAWEEDHEHARPA